jgi:fatty acid desaturase
VAKKSKKKKAQKEEIDLNQPWISMRRGLIIIAITSVAMAVLTAWQTIPSKGWLEGILWGLLFGALIWAVFFGNIFINKLLRK